MQHKKLAQQIFPANIIITILAMLAVTWYGSNAFRDFYINELTSGLKARALLVSEQIGSAVADNSLDSLRSFCLRAGRASDMRITVIAPDGRVLADSNENPEAMDNHLNRPEVVTALQGKTGTSLRYSKTLRQKMLYVAITLPALPPEVSSRQEQDLPSSVLRMSVPLTAIEQILKSVHLKIAMGVLPVICLVILITFFVSRRISRPLEKMRKTAELFSHGDFSTKMADNLDMTASSEVVALAGAMDQMANQLNERINTIIAQRNELETVFSSMVEAIIAIDSQWRIVSLNKAAAQMFGAKRQDCQGRLLQEVVRNVELQQLINDVIESGQPVAREFSLEQGGELLSLKTNGVPLLDSNNDNMGVLLVINDVTHLHRLENIRRDFVANVSHELKTPVTAIRGYVETLLDGALENQEDAERFLEIVLKQTDRLGAIIEDLLDLSRLEEQSDKKEITFTRALLKPALAEVVESCRFKGDQKNITINLSCPADLEIRMNLTLLEQAVTNLVINAIKYSEPGSEVWIRAGKNGKEAEDEVVISVEDSGVGIEPEHLPRLFERFYRSDKARSRKLGGTGLGLSIVKHIAQAHHGAVEVQSRPGQGTVFSIRLPG